MLSIQRGNMWSVLLFSLFLTLSASLRHNYKEQKLNEIEETLDKIEEDHNTLKNLILDTILKRKPKTKAKVADDCICVPFYLCDDGDIIKDGRELLENKGNLNPCYTIADICCEPYLINVTAKAIDDSVCGYSGNIIANGTDVDPGTAKFGEFPWTIAVLTAELRYKCVGSLIHPQVVLTAAHCVNTSENYTVRAGDWDAANKNKLYPRQTEDVKLILQHPKFNRLNLFYNVALLILENPFQLADNVRTACLSQSVPHPLRTFKNDCAASGWGMDKPKTRYRRIMKKVEFSILPYKECQTSFRKTRLGRFFDLHHSFICGVSHYGFDTCEGDGGGPLVCPIPGHPSRYQQVGITSWGIGCTDDTPSVFTRISQIRNWIDVQFDQLNYSKHYYTFQIN